LLQNLPAGSAVTGSDQVERQTMKIVFRLQFVMEITQQGLIEVDSHAAPAAYKMMVCLSIHRFVVRLLSWQMIFANEVQFFEKL